MTHGKNVVTNTVPADVARSLFVVLETSSEYLALPDAAQRSDSLSTRII